MTNRTAVIVVGLTISLIAVFLLHGEEVPGHKMEMDYVNDIAKKIGGEKEVVLWDKTRCDLLTNDYAYEVDYAPKWAEAIGQAQWYSIVTGKKPGVILILDNLEDDRRHILRCQAVCAKLSMKLMIWEK